MTRGSFRPYLPNVSTLLAIVGSRPGSNHPDMRAYWPVRLVQILGGRRWSLSLICYRTEAPVLAEDGDWTDQR